MIQFIGISPSQQVTRSYLRVTLAGGFNFSDLLSGPFSDFTSWPGKVAEWRTAIAAGDFIVPCMPSLPAVSQSGTVTPESRAVVDVAIIGANQGVSYGDVAAAMDTLTPRIDVLSVSLVGTITDDTGRGQALTNANAEAQSETLTQQIGRGLSKVALVLGLAIGALLLIVYLVRRK